MKVAIVINELNIRGGTHKQVLRLCQYLDKMQVNFEIVTKWYDLAKTYKEFDAFNIKYLSEEHKVKDICARGIIGKIVREIDKYIQNKKVYKLISEDVDIINVHDNHLAGVILNALLHKKIIVWQINDLPPCFRVGNSKQGQPSIVKQLKCTLYRILAKKIDVITVNVSKNRERVKQYLNKDSYVLYCGVDNNKNLKLHCHSDLENGINLLSMGVFFPYRNYETLVNVVKRLEEQGLNARLDIIGSIDADKEYYNKIKEMVEKEELSSRITIWGQVDEEKYTQLFDSANAFLFVNVDQSWGLAVFEAMSAGIPTLVSNSVGAIELLNNNEDSIIVDPYGIQEICDVLCRLTNDKKYYDYISGNATKVVRTYSWDDLYSSKLYDIFKEQLDYV